jgi:MinD superfamily P-loop ATPase
MRAVCAVVADTTTASTVAIASGKGGTGKTTVAVNLAAVGGGVVALQDCDVEEPNVHLYLDADWNDAENFAVPVPRFESGKCDLCGKCQQVCRFNAIAVLPEGPLLFPELCHSCGGCVMACPMGAIEETTRDIGTIRTGDWRGVSVVTGRLAVGEAKSPPLIEAVRQALPKAGLVIVDSPPGTSCPLVSSIRDADLVVLVTEPTPFGMHDLKLAVQVVRRLTLPFGVVINRTDEGNAGVEEYCIEENIVVLGRIPDDRRIAEACSRGELIVAALPELRGLFEDLLARIRKILPCQDGKRL